MMSCHIHRPYPYSGDGFALGVYPRGCPILGAILEFGLPYLQWGKTLISWFGHMAMS